MIIDFHTHVGDFRRMGDGREPVTWGNLISRLDDEGIDKAVLLPVEPSPEALISPHAALAERMNVRDQVVDAAAYPDRLIAFGNLDPRWGGNSPSADFGPLLDWFEAQGCRGIGEVSANIPIDDPRSINMFRQIGARGWPTDIHYVGFGPGTYGLQDEVGMPRLAALLQQAPEAVVCGHGQGFWAEIGARLSMDDKMSYPKGRISEEGALPKLLRSYPNLYGDISAGSGYNALTRDPEYGIRFLIEFQDRLLFGTDVCFGDAKGRMPHLKYLRQLLSDEAISQPVFDKITSGNAQRLLRLVEPGH